MPAIVEFNADTYEELFKPIIQSYPELLVGILSDFKSYIDSDRIELPAYFGCEVAYTQPEEAYKEGLMHIHLAIPPVTFPEDRPRGDRKCPMGDPMKDAALVYAQGLYEEDRYTLIAILHPGAHSKARQRSIMKCLAAAARRFRDMY
ncbi:type II toxin-antitoxin system YafO family toxin [Pseudomonas tolaasii]|uniref:type II toxin-antitoxin system YafO family toxin n=1 Tax=Pseudomonas tolaasii TaxID=29442 RepID=UPI0015A39698|nr:type II toxin-antitoxin system YafO family toxin [Pseudomonas tolaasii]NWC26898.1 type II toxin-antitoxin system YafO family toxin [Pseudomonas tolaasii]